MIEITPVQRNFLNTYNNLGIVNPNFVYQGTLEPLPTIYNSVSNPVAPQTISSGYFANDVQSSNYVSGSTGWKLSYDGDLEANDGNFRGDITGSSGTFTGTLSGNTISGATITGGTIQTSASGKRVVMTGASNSIVFYNATEQECGTMQGTTGSQLIITSPGSVTIQGSEASAVVDIYSQDSAILLRVNNQGVNVNYFAGNPAPKTDNTQLFGAANLKWASVYATNHAACPLPTVDNALDMLPSFGNIKDKNHLKNPKKAHYEEQGKQRKYFDIDDVPDDLKFINSEGEKDIELMRTTGFLLKAVIELNKKIDNLKTK